MTVAADIADTPVRVRDVVRGSHLVVAVSSAVLTAVLCLGGFVLNFGTWKGGVDERLAGQKELLIRLENKMDHLTEVVQRRNP